MASGLGFTNSIRSVNRTPSQVLSSELHWVTQWKSAVTLLPRELHLLVHEAEATQLPVLQVDEWSRSVGQDREFLGNELARRDTFSESLVGRLLDLIGPLHRVRLLLFQAAVYRKSGACGMRIMLRLGNIYVKERGGR